VWLCLSVAVAVAISDRERTLDESTRRVKLLQTQGAICAAAKLCALVSRIISFAIS